MRRATVLVCLTVALVGCGHKAVDRAGFVRQADAICRDVARRFGALATETDGAVFYREANRINADGAALLRGIRAPADLRQAIRALAERIDAAARLFDRAARLAVEGKSTFAVEKAIARAGADFAKRARALGLSACGAPTPRP